jgi:superfamily II DNA or RNA helicase
MLAPSPAADRLPFSQYDVQRAVTRSAWDKALAYVRQRRVVKLSIEDDGEHVDGLVRGTAPRPYHVQVCAHPLEEDPDGDVEIAGRCTCPMADNCKHVAAVLLAALAKQGEFVEGAPPIPDALKSGSDASKRPHSNRPTTPRLLQWLSSFQQALGANASPVNDLHYVIPSQGWRVDGLPVQVVRIKRLRDGSPGTRETPVRLEYLRQQSREWGFPQQVLQLLTYLRDNSIALGREPGSYLLKEESGAYLLEQIVASGLCRLDSLQGPLLHIGPPREAKPVWTVMPDGSQHLALSVPEGCALLPFSPAWYLAPEEGLCGPLRHDLPEALPSRLRHAPPLEPEHADAVRAALIEQASGVALPAPHVFTERRVGGDPTPELHLFLAESPVMVWDPGFPRKLLTEIVAARVSFSYEGFRVRSFPPGNEAALADGDTLARVRRNANREAEHLGRLYRLGFVDYVEDAAWSASRRVDADLVLIEDDGLERGTAELLLPLLHRGLPALETDGWRVTLADELPVRLVQPEADWSVAVQPRSGEDWFDLSLGISLDGHRVDLLPLLLQVLQRPGGWEALRELSDDEPVFARLSERDHVALPAGRLRPVLETLADLLDATGDGALRLPRSRAALLAELEEALGGHGLRWQGGEALRELGRRLRDLRGLPAVDPPQGLHGTLRPYQADGLSWLAFLREQDFGGILADDMGLGKTVQTLALLLAEQEAGRLDAPSLIVAPTSVLNTWREQAAQFAPALRVLLLHGPQRKKDFAAIPAHDVVLTSYALLRHDEAVHLAQPYHALILDEAQFVKNPETHGARIAGKLQARLRLCLTGTPMENHLGELWSLVHIVMPGLLGNRAQFHKTFQLPVEKRGDAARRQALARRIAPFLLRRGKDQVARELPPKTFLRHTVELEGRQRELYETVRLAMHEQVRAALAAKGLERSRIVILDALLKLRQVCCDPRLLKLPSARTSAPSAKLARLLELLPELVEAGRRILLYSQFTSMLALIEPELARLGLAYVKLTGRTKDRAAPVARFQDGAAPLFLLSLKAGGTGLNLTAADTVIHYDPWWNPAVEDQASDRAHRIGQDKPVFVHKLATAGTVEERIAAMQERKAGLLRSLFEDTGRRSLHLTPEDVDGLFAPLPG